MGTLLGFDFGTRKIGVAVGQTVTGTASPLTTLRHRGSKPDWTAIEALIREWRPEAAVLGLPFNMDDTEEETLAEPVRRFARQLTGRFAMPVHLVDERLTTIAAERALGSEGRFPGPNAGRGKRRQHGSRDRDALDAYAAKLILETWLTDTRP
ncbi:Holliday junction resolvase RuvX [Thiohalocapsa halophila]|uniref:Putative pre-16S rRNA nuclease n=1 Tax=Thiohalocapsa halophila TaxID=69359 RepID=A0ABS1CC97_9GAMM|nr:Holliday junction resolvase RuvX [Thiohalocapsa halophila]MBK1629500.1 Holliday junction resolvase RuvX [Thiohalocapsa halophila]